MFKTQLESAKNGFFTPEMKDALNYDDHITKEYLIENIAKGTVVIPKNINHKFKARGIGKGLKTKVNANIGTSGKHFDINEEIEKLNVAINAGADSVMDLSTGGDLIQTRKLLLEKSPVMMGAVPIYATAAKFIQSKKNLHEITKDDIFKDLELQCQNGIDYITVHCGITKNTVETMLNSKRELGVVSRGGSILCSWIIKNGLENPLYEDYDRLLDIAYKYDVTLSLGDGFRPGSVCDSTDRGQVAELIILGELAKRAKEKNVQAMIEGPGHVPINEITSNILLQKKLCDEAPFYVLGPLTTDIAPGYDHITSAIGGGLAASVGADFLCYVTPAEHLLLPTLKDVHEGVIASKIAAHTGDIAKGIPSAIKKDQMITKYRKELNWDGIYSVAIDKNLAIKRRSESESDKEDICTMCGDLCAIKNFNDSVTK
jgi:phosphomethylpyrimidine synthase